VATLATSCTDGLPSSPGLVDGDVIPSTIVGRLNPSDWRLDPFVLDSVAALGDTLHLGITFGGGCRPHAFRLVMSTLFLESNPVQAQTLLSHDDGDDPCDGLLHRDVKADLAPLKDAWRLAYQQQSGTIVMQIRLPDTSFVPVRYDF
jgi:hypothetical protein